MEIIVDADACPRIDLITNTAKKYSIKLSLYADDSHNIVNDYANVVIVSKGYQSVDTIIANVIKKNDILITSDFGLALLGLTKNAIVLSPKGMLYTNDNIDSLLHERYMNNKLRSEKVKVKGPKKRTKDDDSNFITLLERLIEENNGRV